jgi:hypothetical protein
MDPTGSGFSAGQFVPLFVGLAIAAAIILRRNSRPRTLRIELMWLRPALFIAIIATSMATSPPPLTLASVAIMALSVVIGVGLGWQRGRFIRIEVHPETHAVTSQASAWGILFILGIVGVRVALRGAMMEGHAAIGVPMTVVTNALVLLFGAMIITSSLEMWLRARRLLADAQAVKAGTISPGANPPIVR